MVKWILDLLRRDIGSVHHAAYLLAGSSFFSLLLALVRDRLLASIFGAGPELDVYYAAFRVQDAIFISIASLLSFAILVPFLAEYIEKGKDELRNFIDTIFTVTLAALFVVSVFAFVFAKDIAEILYPKILAGGYGEQFVVMMRILLLSPVILSVSNLIGAVSQSYRKYYSYALSQPAYNIGIIIGITVLYDNGAHNIAALSWGVVLGAILHLGVQLPIAIRERYLPRITTKINWQKIRPVISLSFFRAVALLSSQIAFTALTVLAVGIGAGSVSILLLSYNIQSIPLSLIGASYSIAAFPIMASNFVRGEKDKFAEQFTTAARHMLFWSVPAAALLIVLRAHIVRVAYGAGAFDWSDTKLTAAALALFAISIPAQCLWLLFLRSYYAIHNTIKPLFISLTTAIGVIALAKVALVVISTDNVIRYFFESLLRVGDVQLSTALSLPLAFSIGSILQVVVLLFMMKKDFGVSAKPILATFFHSLAAGVFAGFAAYFTLASLADVITLDRLWSVFVQGLFAGIIGIFAGMLMLAILKNREFFEFMSAIHGKFKKEEIILPQEEV